MSIKLSNGETIEVARVGRWFLYGFVGALLVTNLRGIAGMVYSVI